MIPELGHFSLIIGVAFAMLLMTVPLIGAARKDQYLVRYAWPICYGMFFFIALSVISLGYSFAVDDFSVAYVAHHSNSQLPIFFKIAAVWGGHEGSLLFWVFSISVWAASVALFSKGMEEVFIARVLAVLAMIIVGFSLFMLITSSPFERIFPIPMEGRDLNPMLQDVGLIFHPPMLYLGYVGFSVSFAFAIAALMSGRLDSAWARWSRPWTLAAWVFLTGGISLGSWWAYYELGWGGWWFWDPVENASFMPWLIGTALVHSLIVTEKRGAFRNWTVLLSIFAFSLSLLGTFIVRSGVLTSVHSFAADPSRGMFILLLLGLAVGGSLTLFALRASQMSSPARFELKSKETFLLVCNVLLTVAAGTVLLGTLYPLLIDALGMGKISVGPPYFNAVFVPIVLVLFGFMGIGPIIRWKKSKAGEIKRQLMIPAIVAAIVGLATPFIAGNEMNLWVAFGIAAATWVALATFRAAYNLVTDKEGKFTLNKIGRSEMGMIIAHLGIAVSIVGATMVSNYSIEKSVRMGPGLSEELAGYTFNYIETKNVVGPNYTAQQGQIEVYYDDEFVTLLRPDRRQYNVRTMDMTEAGIDWGLFRDLYVTMGDPLSMTQFAVRLNYKPFVRWIWFGSIFMMVGGFLAASDKRYRVKEAKTAKEEAEQAKLATA
ncbi:MULTISPECIES: heme lyase CcmF/NrfE family subunit [unclassified Shewanella]|uniref:heme lyase CcmF/NrfE family subunit n=1 Tax=unclassified Shewanella TaxID=196818 RepID=UPI0009708069|nr:MULTISPECIES: heme lyase CcmF/NrfE family subunit [unclassified Shewanella]MDO6621162.1 heme lyase CcmF/NrfE family subunit [Shewanella sp. 6_MG-2023]MDO6642031.1 heme lyase CcmF/NrfE family subunit [Shewanella sp. 5_MG-2023]MDO6777567.1 heme lyase CcmF/NrfE family subunit [Shewanella sp. 3_MG-2023]PMG27464.1 c-type cytochrome biogenesis protein CcmF [Shewanella sp. 10N.286.52.C2]PMG39867.1 c-type cytochrome biogenesis protein CcmF [Shewanella sp. 10N.286.52.B9]